MRVLILGNYVSPHILKWSKSLAKKGIDICLVTFPSIEEDLFQGYDNITVHSLGVLPKKFLHSTKVGRFSKINYLRGIPTLRKIIMNFKPDIVHSHYASGYGLVGALSGFKPFIVSVWGTDVFSFPKVSILHRLIFKFIMLRADKILSTSNIMAEETKKYTNKEIIVTPFGIDLDKFRPQQLESLFRKGDIVVGTIKNLSPKYGIEVLLEAFKILKEKFTELPLKLLIVGGGELESKLKRIVLDYNLEESVLFTGLINYEEVPKYHNMIDIFVALSNDDSESFGVSIIEASATEKPVVVTSVGGLKEVVSNRETGFVIKPNDPIEAAMFIEKLILNKSLREEMGTKGRQRVKELYDFNNNLDQMIQIYHETINKKNLLNSSY